MDTNDTTKIKLAQQTNITSPTSNNPPSNYNIAPSTSNNPPSHYNMIPSTTNNNSKIFPPPLQSHIESSTSDNINKINLTHQSKLNPGDSTTHIVISTLLASSVTPLLPILPSERPIVNIHPYPPEKRPRPKFTISVPSISEEEPLIKKGFFARMQEQEEPAEVHTEELPPDEQSLVPMIQAENSAVDYIICEQCSKSIIVWEAPEHFDWHVARALQKQLTQEIYDEDAKLRQQRQQLKAKSRVQKTPKKKNPITANQTTIDRFFTK